MKPMSIRKTLARAVALILAGAAFAPVHAQDAYVAPRTVDGQPDLQGVWANISTTPLQRPAEFADRASLTDEEFAARAARAPGSRPARVTRCSEAAF